MEHTELERIRALLDKARTPEEVFGMFTGSQAEMLDAARRVFRQMARIVHPDVAQGSTDVEQADVLFKKLMHFWELAHRRIECGIYGTLDTAESFTPFLMTTRNSQYRVERLLARSELWGVYLGSYHWDHEKIQVVIKVPLRPEDNDLMANEARILGLLRASAGYDKRRHFLSQLVETFAYQEQASGMVRQVNVFEYVEGLYSLREVREAYPQGLDPKDMAWIWRRLLVALGFAHANNVIHGGVLPTRVFLQPGEHGLALTDWSCSVHDPAVTGEYICALNSAYRTWYPAEVFVRGEPTPGLDIAMAARCMIELLGGDPVARTMPERVPWQIQSHFKGCTLPGSQQRPQDARLLLRQFDELIERLWGPRRFREFPMPKR